MNSSDVLQLLLSSVVYTLPNFIVMVIGLILSISRRGKFPKTSRISIVAFSTLLLMNVVGFFLPLLHFWLYRTTDDIAKVAWMTFAIGTVTSIIGAAAHGLLIYAIWTERDKS